MTITQVRLKEQSLNASLSRSKVEDFFPTFVSGLTVHLLAGFARSHSGITSVSAQDVTVYDNATSLIELRADGNIYVINQAEVTSSTFTVGAIPIATAVASSGVVTSLTDERPLFAPERALSQFDLVWSNASLDVTIKAGKIRDLGNIPSGAFGVDIAEATLTLLNNKNYLILLRTNGTGSHGYDIQSLEIGNMSNIGIAAPDSDCVFLYALETSGGGVDSVFDLRPTLFGLSFNHDMFTNNNNGQLEIKYHTNEFNFTSSELRLTDGGILDSKLADFFTSIVVGNVLPIANVPYQDGRIRIDNVVIDVASGTTAQALTDNSNNYMEVNSSGTVSINTTGFTSGRIPLFLIVTASGVVTDVQDKRAWLTISSASPTFADNEIPSGTLNGSNVTFTLAHTPISGSLHLYLNGVRQKAGGADYSISSATITFTDAPVSTDTLLADYRY